MNVTVWTRLFVSYDAHHLGYLFKGISCIIPLRRYSLFDFIIIFEVKGCGRIRSHFGNWRRCITNFPNTCHEVCEFCTLNSDQQTPSNEVILRNPVPNDSDDGWIFGWWNITHTHRVHSIHHDWPEELVFSAWWIIAKCDPTRMYDQHFMKSYKQYRQLICTLNNFHAGNTYKSISETPMVSKAI